MLVGSFDAAVAAAISETPGSGGSFRTGHASSPWTRPGRILDDRRPGGEALEVKEQRGTPSHSALDLHLVDADRKIAARTRQTRPATGPAPRALALGRTSHQLRPNRLRGRDLGAAMDRADEAEKPDLAGRGPAGAGLQPGPRLLCRPRRH